jgi:hypothetical protein
MISDTMLAHLARRLGTGEEDLATEALAYILRVAEAAHGMYAHAVRWCPTLGAVSTFRTQAWLAEDEAIPDIVGIADDGQTPLIVEAKFGAALTPNQPVTYLRRLLGRDTAALLLFLVPTRRAAPIWAELLRRCSEAGLELTSTEGQRRGSCQNAVVAVTTWVDLLDDVERALTPPSEHRRSLAELEQLRGLCELADQAVFRPFTSQFLGGDTGRRLMDLDSLLNEAIDSLAIGRLASTAGMARSAGVGYFGRYLRLGGWECFLHVNYNLWGSQRPTPLWLRISDRRAAGDTALGDALSSLVSAQPSRLLNHDGLHHIPIHLPHDVDRDVVFASIDTQLRDVQALLSSAPPPEPGSAT